jgi:hypothetical protein
MMKRPVIGLLLMICVLVGSAHGDTIGLYADFSGVDCNIIDSAPGLLSIFVVHHSPGGATGCQFAAPMPACMVGATYLSDTVAFFQIGYSQEGTAVPYGSCQIGATHALTMNFFASGLTEPCCLYPLIADPDVVEGQVVVIDCDNNVVPAAGLVAVINGDGTCPCGYSVPVHETSWGRIKALYGD